MMRRLPSKAMRPIRAMAATMSIAIGLPVHAATVTVSVGTASGGLGQAIIYAIPTGGTAPRQAPRAAIVDQINKEFVPFVVPVQTGASVTFPNRDNIRHHVYSFSPAKVFDLKLYSGVAAKPVIFDKPGPVALGCNIHDWMVGYVYVVDTPWFAKTDQAGAATLELPGGEYEFWAWHPWQNAETAPQRVRIDAAGGSKVAFRVDITTPKQPRAPQ